MHIVTCQLQGAGGGGGGRVEVATQKLDFIHSDGLTLDCYYSTMSTSYPSLSHSSGAFPLPSVPEDTLYYTIHLSPESRSESDAAALAVLITDYVSSLLSKTWLWNKDDWELKCVNDRRLEGCMRVGDSVDDEWVVVWLLRQVSTRWRDLVIRWVPLFEHLEQGQRVGVRC